MPAASRIVHLATIVGIVGLVGCPGPDSTPPEQASSTEPAVASQASEASSSEAAPPEKPATLEALNPRIVEVGEAGRAPDRIEIRFAQPVVAEANRQASKETDVTIKPSLTGSWTFTDRSTLTFKPSVGFAPDTEYLVVLKSLQSGTAGQPIVGQRNYQRVFTTPSLTLQRMDLIGWNAAEGRAEVSLVFTGPVRFGLRRKAISWSIDSIPRKISVTRGPRLNVWTAVITDRGLRPGSVIDASVASRKVMSLAEFGKYASGSASVSLPKDKAVFIRGAAVVEGTDGFFLRVVCHDEASRGRSIRFWDSQLRERFRLSPRCVLDEESVKSKITLDPPSELRISPTRGGFRVHAPFARGPVKVVIEPGARSVDGGVTASRFTRTLTIPARSPKLEFVAQGRYLPPSAWGTMAVRHQNISRPKLQIRHVTKDNIVRWLSDSGEGTNYKNSDLVVERSIKLDGKPDVLETTSLSLKNILPKPPAGVVEIRIFDRDAYSARSTVRFAVTDLNILAKRHRDGTVRAWVLNAHDHTPVANATVEMVVYSGRTISTCQTDGDGGCALSGIETDAVDKTEPFALLARSGEDFTFINFNQLALDTSGFDVQGVTSSESNPYRTAVYADRGVYRPGETAHVVAVVRTEENKAPPEGMPVVVELYDPKRKVSRRLALKTNEAGMVNADFTFADFADTGRYRADFKAGKLLIGQYSFNVEEFVPERMEVTASTAKASFGTDDDPQINVSARYLFGGSAAGSRYDVRCRLAPARFAPKQHVGYAFDVWRDGSAPTIQLGQVSGTLGAEGKDEISCPGLTSRGKLMSTARLTAQVAVFESGSGRTTQGSASALVHPASMYIGLKSNVQNVSINKTFTVEGVVVDWSGELLTSVDEVDIELLKVEREYGWVYDDYEGRWTSRRHSHLVSTRTTKTKVNDGRFKLELKTTESSPAYVVRARAGDTVVSDLRLGGTWSYWWYYNSTSDATPRPLKPEALQIKAPTKTRVGEPVEVSVNVPHAGRLLWTLETDGVKKAEWQTVEGPGEVRWSFEVDEFEPNVYVSALLLKDPHEESKQSFLPSRLYGVRSIRVLPERYLQTVTIKAPDEVRSNQPLEIELALPEAERPTYVTVAAVDEGILSLTKFRTPDLAKTLFKRRRLGVGTFETIGWNVSLPAGDLGRSTGGDAPGGPGRVQMVKPVAMWSGVLKVPDKGPLKVKFDVPRYRGKLRIMVVGAGSERLVSAEKSVLVRDPIVLQTTLPRFLVQGDEVQVPVFLTNLSGKAQKVSVRLQSRSMPQPGSGSLKSAPNPVKVNGPAVREIELEKDGQATIIYRLSAEAAVGAARLEVQAEAPGIKVSESIDVPFTPNAPRAKRVQRIPLPTGDVDLKPYLKGWMPTTESSTFWVTSNPYGEALDHLKYLIRYPYGCIEQTTSATRPLLFLGGLVRNVDPDQFDANRLENAILAGIDRVLSMQTPSGGFGYWPGASRPVYWGTAYATHLLIDAKKRGYDVPQSRIDDALTWMRRALSARSNQGHATEAKAYMHYVLALGGRGSKAEMLEMLTYFDDLSKTERWWPNESYLEEMRFMLQAGLHIAGDQRFESKLLSPDVAPIRNDRTNGWSFYSDRRRRGLLLSVLVDLFGPREELEPLAQVVSEGLVGHRSYWYTTQELAWGITGLGKMLGNVTKSFTPPELIANGSSLRPATAPDPKKDNGDRTFSLYRASEYDSLVLKNKHGADDKIFLVLSSAGARPDEDWRTGGEGIRVQRKFRDERGEIIDPKKPIPLGSLVYVEISLRNKTSDTIRNVAVVDHFPAAWEIENPRLGRDTRADWFNTNERWYPDHMNLRDARIEAFGALPPGRTVKLLYLLRAVTAGSFTVPPVEAEAMYDPARWGRERGPRINVRGPWDDQ